MAEQAQQEHISDAELAEMEMVYAASVDGGYDITKINAGLLLGMVRELRQARMTGYPLHPAMLRFRDPDTPCAHWSDGYHIAAADGRCRCGLRFAVLGVKHG